MSANIIGAVLGLLSTVIKTRSLGVEQFGLLSVIIAYVVLIRQFSSFGTWQALIKFGADALAKEQPSEFMGQVKLGLFLDGVGAVSGTAIAVIGGYLLMMWQGWNTETNHMVVVFSLSILFDWSGTSTGVLRLLDRFEMLSLKNISTGILAFAGALFVYLSGGGIWDFLIVTLISSILGSLLLVVMAFIALRSRRLTQYWRVPIKTWKPFLDFSMWTYMESTLDIPVKKLDILIVSAVISLEAAGIYKIITQVCSLLGLLADPIYQAVYPQFATMIAHRDSEGAVKYALKIGCLFLAVTGIPAVFLAVSSVWWLGVIFGEGFSAGALPLSAFLLINIIGFTLNPVHPLFAAFGYVKQSSIIVLFSNMLYLMFAWQLGLRIGLFGLAIATGLEFGSMAVLKALYIRRKAFQHAITKT